MRFCASQDAVLRFIGCGPRALQRSQDAVLGFTVRPRQVKELRHEAIPAPGATFLTLSGLALASDQKLANKRKVAENGELAKKGKLANKRRQGARAGGQQWEGR